MRKYPVVWFYILAFGFSWLGWMPAVLASRGVALFDAPYFRLFLILPAIGPALAAVIVARVAHGRAGVRELLRALIRWRVGLLWYVVAVLGPALLFLAGRLMTRLLDLTTVHPGPQGDWLPLAISTLLISLLSNPWEEVGWRGFALPHLQKQYRALPATLIVGLLWGLWHLPLFFWVGNPMSEYPFLPWLVSTVAQAFLYTWLYNRTGGSILLAALFHVMLNTWGAVVPGVSVIVLALLYCIIAITLAMSFGSLSENHEGHQEHPKTTKGTKNAKAGF